MRPRLWPLLPASVTPQGGHSLAPLIYPSPTIISSLEGGASLVVTHKSFSAILEADITMSSLWFPHILYPSPMGPGGLGGGSPGTPFTCLAPIPEQKGSCFPWVDRCYPRCVWIYLVGEGPGVEQGCTLSALRLSETGDLRHSPKRRSRSLLALLVLFGVATSSRSFRR